MWQKKNLTNICKVLSVFLLVAFAKANAEVNQNTGKNDGDVHFYGQVVNGACSIDADSQDLTVKMGQFQTNDFESLGKWLDPVEFHITLKDCDNEVTKTVGTLFTGVTDGKNPSVFKTGFGSSASHGVGLGIFDINDNLIVPNAEPQFFLPLNNGDNTLTFMARYQATDKSVEAGEANTQVWFNMIYQ